MRGSAYPIAFVILVAGTFVYRYLTDAERVRAQAERYLSRFVNADVHVHAAQFSFFHGIHLAGVEVTQPQPAESNDPTGRPTEFVVFYCRDLLLRHDPALALLGRLAVNEVVAVNPTCSVVHDARTGRFNVDTLLRPRPGESPTGLPHRPILRLRDASLHLSTRTAEGLEPVETLKMHLLARPDPDHPFGYRIAWVGGGEQRSRGRTQLDLRTMSLVDLGGGLPWVSLEAVLLAVNARIPGAARYCELLGLEGQVRAEDYSVTVSPDPQEANRATIRLRDATLAVPLDEAEKALLPDERYLRFTGVHGSVEVHARGARAEFEGKLHDSPCRVVADLHGPATGDVSLSAFGFDVNLEVEELKFPRRDPAHLAEARFVDRWDKLQKFYRDFDPQGTVSLTLSVSKAPGESESVRLHCGRLDAIDVDATHRAFPYRVHGLQGTIDIDDGGIWIREVRGTHAGATIVAKGWVEGARRNAAADVEITGTSVSLDRDLYDGVSGRYRQIWDQFALEGTADIAVRLHHPITPPDGESHWDHQVRAELRDGRACFAGFPYPVERLHGAVDIDSGGISLSRLTGSAGPGTVAIDGRADLQAGDLRDLNITLQADGLAFDDPLLAALPEDARALVQSFSPQGQFNLSGTLKYDPSARSVDYDLHANIRNAKATYDGLPVAVESVSGTVRLRPGRIDVSDVRGRYRDAAIAITGSHGSGPDTERTNLTIECTGLQIDENITNKMPPTVSEALQLFEVHGPLNTRTSYERRGTGAGAQSTLRTDVEIDGASVRYAPFPLPFENVHGHLTVTEDGTTKLDWITAEHDDARFELDGSVVRRDEQTEARLRVRGSGLCFDEDLRQAVPWRWRRIWNNVQPDGGFDLDLTELVYSQAPDQPGRWTFSGSASFTGLALDLGVQLSGGAGHVSGRGNYTGGDEGLSFTGPIELERILVNQREITDVQGHLQRSGRSGDMELRDLRGNIYRGTATGRVEWTSDEETSRYDARATLRGIDLLEFLSAGRDATLPPLDTAGQLDARIYLSGVSDKPEAFRGGGRVDIHDAHLFHLPLFVNLLNVLTFVEPEGQRQQEASAEFFLTQGRAEIKDIVLRDPGLAMIGSGSMDLDSKSLDVTLIAGNPQRSTTIPVLTELLEGTGREIVEVQVKGPPGDAVIQARPLRGVSDAIETLIQPKKPGKK